MHWPLPQQAISARWGFSPFSATSRNVHPGVPAQDLHVDAGADGVDAPHPAALQVVRGLRLAVQQQVQRPLRRLGNARHGGEVVAAATGDDAQVHLRQVRDAVQHLVQRAVAAHGHQVQRLARGARRQLPGDVDGLVTVVGLVEGVLHAQRPEPSIQRRSELDGPALSGDGVVDKVEHGTSILPCDNA